jgi:hypothetical protein
VAAIGEHTDTHLKIGDAVGVKVRLALHSLPSSQEDSMPSLTDNYALSLSFELSGSPTLASIVKNAGRATNRLVLM